MQVELAHKGAEDNIVGTHQLTTCSRMNLQSSSLTPRERPSLGSSSAGGDAHGAGPGIAATATAPPCCP